MKTAMMLGSLTPIGAAAGAASATAASSAAASTPAVAQVASGSNMAKPKLEYRLAYKLIVLGNEKPVLDGSVTVKAKPMAKTCSRCSFSRLVRESETT